MLTKDAIRDSGGAVSLMLQDKQVRLASIDGTRTADVIQLLQEMLEAAREEGRNQPRDKAA